MTSENGCKERLSLGLFTVTLLLVAGNKHYEMQVTELLTLRTMLSMVSDTLVLCLTLVNISLMLLVLIPFVSTRLTCGMKSNKNLVRISH